MQFCFPVFVPQGSVQEMLNLSQQEYVNRIDELNNALISAWDQDQRVKALKIVIQVCVFHIVLFISLLKSQQFDSMSSISTIEKNSE